MIIKSDLSYSDITDNRLGNTSYLKLFNLLQDTVTSDYLFNIWKGYEVNDEIYINTYYELYEVENEDWWDSISYKYYQTPDLWWLLTIINNVDNPFEFLEEGKQIYILKNEFLYSFLKEVKNIGVL
jgi:hypothetical protein